MNTRSNKWKFENSAVIKLLLASFILKRFQFYGFSFYFLIWISIRIVFIQNRIVFVTKNWSMAKWKEFLSFLNLPKQCSKISLRSHTKKSSDLNCSKKCNYFCAHKSKAINLILQLMGSAWKHRFPLHFRV